MSCQDHKHLKKGSCDDCGRCRRCPPPPACRTPGKHIRDNVGAGSVRGASDRLGSAVENQELVRRSHARGNDRVDMRDNDSDVDADEPANSYLNLIMKAYVLEDNNIEKESDIFDALKFREGIKGSSALLLDASRLEGPTLGNKRKFKASTGSRSTHEVQWVGEEVHVIEASNISEPEVIKKRNWIHILPTHSKPVSRVNLCQQRVP